MHNDDADGASSEHVDVPWEQRFRAELILWAAIARTRSDRGLVCSSRSGAFQLQRWDVTGGRREDLTHVPSGKIWGALSPDGEWVVWHGDEAGNENGHFVATRWATEQPRDLTPDLPAYSSFMCTFADDGWFAAPVAEGTTNYLLVVPWLDGGPGDAKRLALGPGYIQQVAVGSARQEQRERLIAYATIVDGPAFVLRVVDADTGARLLELSHAPGSVIPVSYFNDGSGLLLASTSRSGQIRPMIVEPSGAIRMFELGEVAGDLTPIDLWNDAEALILRSHRSVEQLHVLDLATGVLRPLDQLTGTLAPFFPGLGTFFSRGGTVIVTRQDSARMPEVVEVDASDGALVRVLIDAPDLPPAHELRSIDIATPDGATVQGWLATPDGAGPFPTVIEVHGGPDANESDRFNAPAQAWIDSGFAYLTLNYRGSTGFGRDFQQAIWGHPGELEMIDIVAARDHLVTHGIARPGQVAIHGASYGGFLTLLTLGRTHDLFAAGVAWVAIADWRRLFEYSTNTRDFAQALFKGTPEERPEAYRAASPLTYVDGLAAPLLIIQGRNDVRCPPQQIEEYLSAARAMGKDVEIDWFDAGHVTVDMETLIGFMHRSISFVQDVFARQTLRQSL